MDVVDTWSGRDGRDEGEDEGNASGKDGVGACVNVD